MNNQPSLESLRDILREQSKRLAEKAQKIYEELANTTIKMTSSEYENAVVVEASCEPAVMINFSSDFLKTLFPEASVDQLEYAAMELSKTATMTTNEAIQKTKEISKEKLNEITADINPDLLESDE